MKKKNVYEVIFNSIEDNYQLFQYNYGNVKNIKLLISKNGFKIEVTKPEIIEINKIINKDNVLFSDAIKKSYLIQLMVYGRNCDVDKITIIINGKAENIKINKGEKIIYSLIEDEIEPFDKNFLKQEIIENILQIKKSHNDSRISSLYAFLISRSKKYKIEEFLYLWMAFNGMYNYLSKVVDIKSYGLGKKFDIKKEYCKLQLLKLYYKYGKNEKIDDKNDVLYNKVVAMINNQKMDIHKRYLSKNELDFIFEQTKKIIKNFQSDIDISPEGYFLVKFAYKFRCNSFHANKPLNLFSFSDEKNIKVLQVINTVLVNFINNNLYKYFDKNF